MDFLASDNSPLLRIDSQYRDMKANYEGWKETVAEYTDDLRDYFRMSKELRDAEKEHQRLLDDISHYNTKIRKQKSDVQDLQQTDDEMRDIVDLSKRWSEDAARIAEKGMQVAQKKVDLSASISDTGRDLRTVERDLNNLMEQKDELANKITNLNREMTQINTAVNNLSAQVSSRAFVSALVVPFLTVALQAARMDQIARDKEERFSTERKNAERKAEVAEQLQKIGQEEKKLQDQLAPLNKKIQAKKTEKDRARALGEEEESALSKEIVSFNADVQDLRILTWLEYQSYVGYGMRCYIDSYQRKKEQ